jgi:hypothetical protein
MFGKIGGLWNNYGQGQGSLCNSSRDFLVLYLFSKGKWHGHGPPLVDHGRHRRQGLSGGSLELGLAAALGHGGLPHGWQCEECDAVSMTRHTGGGTLAPSDEDVSVREEGRR